MPDKGMHVRDGLVRVDEFRQKEVDAGWEHAIFRHRSRQGAGWQAIRLPRDERRLDGRQELLGLTHACEHTIHATVWYHMYGGDTGALAVEARTGVGGWAPVWSMHGQQQAHQSDPWRASGPVPLPGGTTQVRFVGTQGKGYAGDVAVDTITLVKLGWLGRAERWGRG